MKSLIGTGVALITPFKKDKNVDTNALKNIVNHCINNGVNYLVVLGTTAETATLTQDEKKLVKQTIINENNKRVPLVLGVGGNNTKEVAEQLNPENLAGFDAILSVSPYYNKPSQEGIYQHFKYISEKSLLPILLYNVPSRTGSNMLPETVIRLANNFDNIIGIKEAAGDIVQAMELIQNKPKDFLIISGDDILTLPIVLAGGSGVISVIGEALPKDFSQMVQYGLNRDVDEAYKIHYKLTEITNLIFEEGNPVGVKELFKQLNLCENTVRLPLVNSTEKLSKKINNYLKNNYTQQ